MVVILCKKLLYLAVLFNVQKPESWRLACQTIVGNKENSGKVCCQNVFSSLLISVLL